LPGKAPFDFILDQRDPRKDLLPLGIFRLSLAVSSASIAAKTSSSVIASSRETSSATGSLEGPLAGIGFSEADDTGTPN
jgi:hypothetical protein